MRRFALHSKNRPDPGSRDEKLTDDALTDLAAGDYGEIIIHRRSHEAPPATPGDLVTVNDVFSRRKTLPLPMRTNRYPGASDGDDGGILLELVCEPTSRFIAAPPDSAYVVEVSPSVATDD